MQQATLNTSMSNNLKIPPRYISRRYTLLFIIQQYDKEEADKIKNELLELLGIGAEMLNKYLYMKNDQDRFSLSPERIGLIAKYFKIEPHQVVTENCLNAD